MIVFPEKRFSTVQTIPYKFYEELRNLEKEKQCNSKTYIIHSVFY